MLCEIAGEQKKCQELVDNVEWEGGKVEAGDMEERARNRKHIYIF